jgi:arylsulfatase A-like enzyme
MASMILNTRRGPARALLLVAALALLKPTSQAEAAGSYRPNIVMVVPHDIGQHLGCYGVDTVQTPNIDGLAAKGIRFENFYSTSAVCSPGRGSLHTGRYPQSNGLMGLTHGPWWWELNEDERHTASYLKELGYETYLIGLQHLGQPYARLGYDHHLSRGRKAPESVAAARKLIQARKPTDRPLFAKIGFVEVHRPFEYDPDTTKGVYVPPWLKDSPQTREDLARFQGEITYFDEQVGKILAALEESAIAGETLVIVTGEHGIPYVGAKWSIRKAGIEVPLILYQPGTVFSGGKVFRQLMSNVDVLPTLLDFLGMPIPDRIEGVSYKSLIEGKAAAAPRREICAQFTPAMKRDNESRCILTERYHLIWYCQAGRVLQYPVDVHPQQFAAHVVRVKTGGTRPFFQLFDIRDDPFELEDLGAKPKHAAVVKDLRTRLRSWMKKVDDPLLRGPTASPYYKRALRELLE